MTELSGEAQRFLLESPTVILSVPRGGRAPLAAPLWFGWDGNAVLTNTFFASKKVALVRKDPLVSCLVESGARYADLQYVHLTGHWEIDDDQERVSFAKWWSWLCDNKPLYRELLQFETLPPPLQAFYGQPRVTLRIIPEHVTVFRSPLAPR